MESWLKSRQETLDQAYEENTKYLELSRTAEERYGLSHDDFVRMYEQAQREGMDFEAWMDKKQADEAKAYYETAKYLELSRTAEERYGLSHDDFVRMYEQAQNEGMDFETWMSKPEAKAELSALRAQQGGGTTVVETGGQGGLNIGGGERSVVETETTRPRTGTSQQTMQGKISSLEQKYNDLHNKTDELLLAKADASLAYLNAKEAGASPEELARLQAEYDRLQKEVDTAFKEQDAAKAELSALRAQQGEQSKIVSSQEEPVFDTTALREELRNKLSEELRQRANEQSEQPISGTTTLQEAAKNVDDASAKAELASRDYLNALKTGERARSGKA